MTVSAPPRDCEGETRARPMVRLDLPADHVAVSIARAAVRRSFRFRDEEAESGFLVALTEIVTNAVAEHLRLELAEPVRVTLDLGDRPSVEVTDRGGGLDPERAYDADADVVPDPEVEVGRGIIVARGFVPSLEYRTGPEGTIALLPLADLGRTREP